MISKPWCAVCWNENMEILQRIPPSDGIYSPYSYPISVSEMEITIETHHIPCRECNPHGYHDAIREIVLGSRAYLQVRS